MSKVVDGSRVGRVRVDSLSRKLLFLKLYHQENIGFRTFCVHTPSRYLFAFPVPTNDPKCLRGTDSDPVSLFGNGLFLSSYQVRVLRGPGVSFRHIDGRQISRLVRTVLRCRTTHVYHVIPPYPHPPQVLMIASHVQVPKQEAAGNVCPRVPV